MFTNECDKIGKDFMDFSIELVDGAGWGSMFLDILADSMWTDG